jgi:hypothetical protein
MWRFTTEIAKRPDRHGRGVFHSAPILDAGMQNQAEAFSGVSRPTIAICAGA